MNEDRIEIGALYESIYAGDAVYGDDDNDKDEKDTDTKDVEEKDTDSSDDSSDSDDKGSDNDSDSDSDDSDSNSDEDSDDSDSNSDEDSDDSDSDDSDSDSDEDSDDKDGEFGGDSDSDGDSDGDSPKGDGSFSTDVDSLRKQYSELLANVFGEFAPNAIEAALDDSDGPFGDNIQTIIQTAIDHLKGMIYDEFELEDIDLDIDLDIDPSAMGSFDPNAATDIPMELDIGDKPKIDRPFGGKGGKGGKIDPELDISIDSDDEDGEEYKSGLEEGCKKKNKKEKVSKLEECAKNFEPVTMRRTSRMSRAYNK